MEIYGNETALIEDFYWLTQNEYFDNQINSIRSKYKMPLIGFTTKLDYETWEKSVVLENLIAIENDLLELMKKAELYKSQYSAQLPILLRTYFYFNIISNNYPNTPTIIPEISIKKQDNLLNINISFPIDLPLKAVVTKLRNEYKAFKNKNCINTRQLRTTSNFNYNKELWELHLQGKTNKEIGDSLEIETDYIQIATTLANIKNRISRNYKI